MVLHKMLNVRSLDDDDEPEDTSPYKVKEQIGGLFLIIFVSFLGVTLSFLLSRGTPGPKVKLLLMLFKGIGTGVLISTAMVHLINEAYETIGGFGYDALPMVIAMFAMYIMALFDFYSSRLSARVNTCKGVPDNTAPSSNPDITDPERQIDFGHGHSHSSSEGTTWRQAVLVEGSVLTHSVVVGYTLGLQKSHTWATLVIAISFHQFFEGIALGQVVVSAGDVSNSKKVMTLIFYSLTTAIGIGLGIMTVLAYDSDGDPTKGLNILIGVLNSVCGGMLLYLGIVHLFWAWIINNNELHSSPSPSHAFVGFTGVFLGMGAMDLIGVWA